MTKPGDQYGFLLPRRYVIEGRTDEGIDEVTDKVTDQGAQRTALTRRRYSNFFSRISPTSAGFALPLLSFMTWPLRKFSAAGLPAL